MAQINKPNTYFNTVLYSGDGTSNRSITGVNFQPDLVWIKNRNSTNSHQWVDSVRGLYRLGSHQANAESSVSGAFNSFDSDGFNVTEEVNWEFNNSGKTYVAWNWLAGGTASSNTDGSITSSVSANTTSGFSIVSYTGTGSAATVGHGLGVAPKVVIVKNRTDGTDNWEVLHMSLGSGYTIYLNATDAAGATSARWNNTDPTSSVFTVGTTGSVNGSSENLVAYCFAEKKGFSKFGSYTGNGNADGPFIYTGFKPAWLMVKYSSGIDNWNILDNKRSDVANANPNDQTLYANATNAEVNETLGIDLLSNGFKVREAGSGWCNVSGGTYIYMAFAAEPLVGQNNIPACAR